MIKSYLKILAIVVVAVAMFVIGRSTAETTLFGGNYTGFPNGITVGGGDYAEVPALAITGKSQLGTSGTFLSQLTFGSTTACVLGSLGPTAITASHPATTTKVYDCAVSGVLAGDVVFGSISTSTVSGAAGWSVVSAKASSTSGYIELGIYNGTGAAGVPANQGVGSSTNVLILR